MPTYQNNPFTPLLLLQEGVPLYLFGSRNYKQGDTRMLISRVAGSGTTATLTVQIVAGEIPAVGSLVSVQQTQTSAGAFNVNRVALTAVSINASGAGTISFASATTAAATADTGTAVAEVPEVPDTLQAGASAACAVSISDCDSQKTVAVAVTFGTLPTAATVTLQQALLTQNSGEWTNTSAAVTVASSAYTTGPVVLATLQRGYAYRLNVTGLTIGSGSGIVGKIG